MGGDEKMKQSDVNRAKTLLSYGSNPTKSPTTPSTAQMFHKVLKCVSLAALYIMASSGMIIYNKYLLHDDRFPYPVALTTMHMAAALLLGSALYRVEPGFFPSASALFDSSTDLESQRRGMANVFLTFAPIGLCGAVAIVCGNAAYQFASVSFLQMIKEGNIVCIYAMMLLFGLDTFKLTHALILIFVAASASYATSGAIFFTWHGLLLQLLSGLGQSMQVVLTNRLMSRSNGLKIDAMTMVLCTAPVMLLALLPLNVFYWHSEIPARLITHSRALLANVALALALQIISTMTVREISATGHALASLLKDIAIVCGAAMILHEVISNTQFLGFTLSVIGIFVYSSLKICPQWWSSV